MAIELNTSGLAASIRRSSGLPTVTTFTACCWAKYVGTPTSDGYAALILLANDVGGATAEYIGLYKQNLAATMALVGDDAGAFQEQASAFSLTANEWFFAALVNQGTGASDLIGYLAAANSASFTTWTGQGRTFTPNRIAFGYDPFTISDYWPGDASHFRVWNRVLTPAELAVERWSFWAKFRDSLLSDSPAFNAADNNGTANDLRDYSGQGNHWDLGEALRDIDNLSSSGQNIAPVGYGARPLTILSEGPPPSSQPGPSVGTDGNPYRRARVRRGMSSGFNAREWW